MASQEDRLANLLSRTQQARYEFLRSELNACFAAAECGTADLLQGRRDEAENQAGNAERGYEGIVHFLSVLDEGENRSRIEAEWNALRARLDELQEMLKSNA